MTYFKYTISGLVAFGVSFIQIRTTYPEDKFLLPFFWFALIVVALGILVALYLGTRNKKPDSPRSSAKNKLGTAVKVELNSDDPEEKKFYAKLGNHEIEVSKTEAKSLAKQNYKIIEK